MVTKEEVVKTLTYQCGFCTASNIHILSSLFRVEVDTEKLEKLRLGLLSIEEIHELLREILDKIPAEEFECFSVECCGQAEGGWCTICLPKIFMAIFK